MTLPLSMIKSCKSLAETCRLLVKIRASLMDLRSVLTSCMASLPSLLFISGRGPSSFASPLGRNPCQLGDTPPCCCFVVVTVLLLATFLPSGLLLFFSFVGIGGGDSSSSLSSSLSPSGGAGGGTLPPPPPPPPPPGFEIGDVGVSGGGGGGTDPVDAYVCNVGVRLWAVVSDCDRGVGGAVSSYSSSGGGDGAMDEFDAAKFESIDATLAFLVVDFGTHARAPYLASSSSAVLLVGDMDLCVTIEV
mmetsp:Transcript_26428/g.42466  ORF Transcript_26428/g.42466 Transcript_26428/m.42466 type:complete len:247 (-) Transcript_26428:205-945(-)